MKKIKRGKLYLIPTPLSENSLDKMVTIEMSRVIKSVDYFLAENVRTARRFISSLKLGIKIEDLHFDVLDKKTSDKSIKHLCTPLLKGKDMGVLSEAGCPGIADPGNLAVAFAHQQNIEVIPLVGPSSIFLALMASGFNGQSFVFHGYLPIDKQKRMQAIKSLEKYALNKRQTQIFLETQFRNDQVLNDLLKYCQPYTKLCVAKDVSGASEMIKTQMITEWKKSKPSLHKVPTIFIVYI
jgi:16S rRNA (cytidine1402-2'-O)-methyltransferase